MVIRSLSYAFALIWGMGPRAARAYARAAAAGTVSVMSVFKFTNLYSMKSCNAGVVALVSRARDAYAVIECREHLQIM